MAIPAPAHGLFKAVAPQQLAKNPAIILAALIAVE